MSDSRRAVHKIRCLPTTLRRLNNLKKETGKDIPTLLEELVPHKRKKDGFGTCRYCDAETKNPRGRHDAHERWCVLWADQVTGR